MTEWWSAMNLLMQSVWCVAFASSLIFIIQSIMTFMGMDSDGGMDIDVDAVDDGGGTPFQLFTFRNLVNFMLGTSWAMIAFETSVESLAWRITISVGVGVLLVTAVMMMFRFFSRMEQSGTVDIGNAIDCKGNVYLKIPAAKKGEGKVQITIQGAVREYNALTEGEEIETGAPVVVKRVVNGNTLIVERF